jgi:hypothetical protein
VTVILDQCWSEATGFFDPFLRTGEYPLVDVTDCGHTHIATPLKSPEMTPARAAHTHNRDLNLFLNCRGQRSRTRHDRGGCTAQ